MFAGNAHLYSLWLLLPGSKVRKLRSELVTASGIEKLEDLLLSRSPSFFLLCFFHVITLHTRRRYAHNL